LTGGSESSRSTGRYPHRTAPTHTWSTGADRVTQPASYYRQLAGPAPVDVGASTRGERWPGSGPARWGHRRGRGPGGGDVASEQWRGRRCAPGGEQPGRGTSWPRRSGGRRRRAQPGDRLGHRRLTSVRRRPGSPARTRACQTSQPVHGVGGRVSGGAVARAPPRGRGHLSGSATRASRRSAASASLGSPPSTSAVDRCRREPAGRPDHHTGTSPGRGRRCPAAAVHDRVPVAVGGHGGQHVGQPRGAQSRNWARTSRSGRCRRTSSSSAEMVAASAGHGCRAPPLPARGS